MGCLVEDGSRVRIRARFFRGSLHAIQVAQPVHLQADALSLLQGLLFPRDEGLVFPVVVHQKTIAP